ncbi:MAG: ABC transporter permease [Legionellales bacterium]|nr:ABC transporter permease [Legionellales bacterium]
MINTPLFTLMYKEVYRFMRLWRQTLIPPVISSSLYLMIFGQILGNRIGAVQGVGYTKFVLPGLVMLSMIISSFQNTASSFYGEKFQKSIEEILIAPLANYQVIIGFLCGGIARGVICGSLVLLVGVILTNIHFAHPLYLMYTMLITTSCFAAVGMLNGMLAKTFDHITIFPDFILMPLIFLGGVFYNTQELPGVLKSMHVYNPIVYFVDAARYAILGVSEFSSGSDFLVISMVGVFVISFLSYCFNKGFGFRE